MHPLYAPFETQDKAFDSSRASQGRQGKKGGVPEKARRDSSSRERNGGLTPGALLGMTTFV